MVTDRLKVRESPMRLKEKKCGRESQTEKEKTGDTNTQKWEMVTVNGFELELNERVKFLPKLKTIFGVIIWNRERNGTGSDTGSVRGVDIKCGAFSETKWASFLENSTSGWYGQQKK